jgi:hypothetical protein
MSVIAICVCVVSTSTSDPLSDIPAALPAAPAMRPFRDLRLSRALVNSKYNQTTTTTITLRLVSSLGRC